MLAYLTKKEQEAMTEAYIENYLSNKVRKAGGEAYKFTSPSRRNVPDRIMLFPGGRIIFVELKAPGKKPTAGQEREHKRLRKLGFQVDVVGSILEANSWLQREVK